MICAVAFALLMIYVIFAAVMCSIQAATQGDHAYQVMLFSIIVTYGSMCHSTSYRARVLMHLVFA